jgi:hypothetical protein
LSRRSALVLAALLTVTAAVLVFLGSRQFIGYDSYWHVFIARQDRWPNFWQEVRDNAHPPLFFLLLRLAAAWLGPTFLAYRAVSIAAMVASTWLIAAIVRRTTCSRGLAIAAAAAFGLSYNAVNIGIEVRAYSLASAFMLAACVFYIDWLRTPAHRLTIAPHVGFALTLTAAVVSSYSTFFFMTAAVGTPAVLAVVDRGWRRRLMAKFSSRPAATALMFGPPFVVAAIAYYLHVIRWAGGLNHVPEHMFDATRETVVAFLWRNTLNLAAILVPGGDEFVAGLHNWRQWAFVAVIAGMSLLGLTRLVRTRRVGPGAVAVLLLGMMVALNAVAGLASRYPYGGVLRHEFFLVPFAVTGFFTLIDAARRSVRGAFRSRALWAAAATCGILASVASWTSTFRIAPEALFQAQMDRFKATARDPDAVLVDLFTFINFFSHHHDWQWRLDGEWPKDAVRQVWLVEKDSRRQKLCRENRQWAMDMANVATYWSLEQCAEKSRTSRVALFRTQWSLQQPSWDTAKTSQFVEALSRKAELTPIILAGDSGDVYAEFAVSNSLAGRISVTRATYGANCRAAEGNATAAVRNRCDGRSRCLFEVQVSELGDPSHGCLKEFTVDWRCERDPTLHNVTLPAEAGFGSVARLVCGR